MATSNPNNLLVDAGNSSLKWALSRQDRLVTGTPMIYQPSQGSHRDSLLVTQLAESWQSLVGTEDSPDRIVVSNVAGPSIMDAINQWVSDHLERGLSAKEANRLTIDNVVAQEDAYGVKNAYAHPELLGPDRWAGLIAARHLVMGDCCIIDCGSALTIDIISQSGEHKGGTITPGWQMMKKSLMAETSAITGEMVNSESSESSLLGRDTQGAIKAGIAAACAGAVYHVVQRYQEETGSKLHCVITGGDAQKLLPRLCKENPEVVYQHEPDWVLKGLAIISDGAVEEENIDDRGNIK